MTNPATVLDFEAVIIIASFVLAFVALASWLFNEDEDEKESPDG